MMFRKIRRKDRQISAERTHEILSSENYGVLSVSGDDGYPYGVPINYAYVDGKLYFHSTCRQSHKLDAIQKSPKVCFTVVSRHDIALEELSTDYESVVLFGTARILEEPSEKADAMKKMMNILGKGTKYATDYICGDNNYVMVEINPEHITGKARKGVRQ